MASAKLNERPSGGLCLCCFVRPPHHWILSLSCITIEPPGAIAAARASVASSTTLLPRRT